MSGDGHIEDVNDHLLGHVVAERYFVEDRLGEGGMGTVYTARHVTLDKRVALKVLHGEFSRKPDLVERFLQEAKAASSIRNEHVIDITDFGVTGEGFVFFTMEHLQGRDLHSLLGEVTAEGTLLPWERSKNIFLQVCEALSAAHAQGIIHRDLKPENIFLVDGTGRADYVKLLDFGIAKVEGSGPDGERKLTKTGMLFGTPEYMAPEQARGEKPDHRVDVYAMGCLLFQFLAGTVPFKADSFMAILTQHMVEPVPEIGPELLEKSGAPAGLIGVVHKALAKDREERFADIAALSKAVQEAGISDGVPIAPPAGHQKKRSGRSTDWTGSIRGIDTLVEQEVEEDEKYAQQEQAGLGKSKLLLGIAGAVVIGGGLIATFALGGGDDKDPAPAAVEQVEAPTAAGGAEAQPADTAGAVAPPATDAATAEARTEPPEVVPPAGDEGTKPVRTVAGPEGSGPPAEVGRDGDAKPKLEPKPKGDIKAKVDTKPRGDKTAKADKPKGDKPKGDKPKVDKPKGDKPKVDKPKDDGEATVGEVETISPFQ